MPSQRHVPEMLLLLALNNQGTIFAAHAAQCWLPPGTQKHDAIYAELQIFNTEHLVQGCVTIWWARFCTVV